LRPRSTDEPCRATAAGRPTGRARPPRGMLTSQLGCVLRIMCVWGRSVCGDAALSTPLLDRGGVDREQASCCRVVCTRVSGRGMWWAWRSRNPRAEMRRMDFVPCRHPDPRLAGTLVSLVSQCVERHGHSCGAHPGWTQGLSGH
jgi:hypothetical protein